MNRRRLTREAFLRCVGEYHSGQLRIWQQRGDARFTILRCGRRFGKTSLLARELLWTVLRGGKAWWIAPRHALCRIGFSYVEKLSCNLPVSIRQRIRFWRSAPYRIRYGRGEAEFYSTSNPDNLQGEGNDLVIFDEAATEEDGDLIVDQYILPTLLDRHGKLIIASTPKGRNWFAEWCARPEFVELVATTYDNPLIDRADIDAMRERMTEQAFRQEILAEIVEETGRYWDVLPVASDWEVTGEAEVCGIDWGIASPFAAVWLFRRGEEVHVLHEVYGSGMDADVQAKLILRGPRAKRYVCDPSTPEHVLRVWHNAGLHPQPGSRDRVGGWMLLRIMIRDGHLRVHPRCFNLLREFEEAQVDPRAPSDIVNDDHALDALRYAIIALPPSRKQRQMSVEEWLRVRARREYLRRTGS
ncbi:MAG: hypothetical protein KatS3mg023_0583 [Armatimonadota bacterium]|nr:MAG: hypothetical protein KatS3mg023_0583 [Armatimonadota bacterium]